MSAVNRFGLLTRRLGDINEQYPYLLPALTIIIVSLLVPELSILRLLGFGSAGPVAGALRVKHCIARDELIVRM